MPHAEIPALVRAADAFVLNSEYEGLSHTLLEVSVLGTPAVATGVCGNPEVVEDGGTGYLVPPDDAKAMAAAVRRYFDADPAAFRAAIERENEKYSWDRMVETVESVHAELRRC